LPTLEAGRAFMPSVEVYTTENEVVVKAELPGLEAKDVNVEVLEDAIHLTGELKKEEEIKEDNYYRSERQYGHFERMIPLPNRVKDSDAKATFKHGVLTVRAPLAEEVKKPQGRKLQIEE
jgi:HSP20 family protein